VRRGGRGCSCKRPFDHASPAQMAMGTDTFPLRIRSILLIHQCAAWGKRRGLNGALATPAAPPARAGPGTSLFWSIVRPFLKAKLTKRLRLLGADLPALHAIVPREVLPPEFGGTLSDSAEPADWLLADMRRRERDRGSIGGWALPLSVEDPTGAVRRAAAAAAVAAAAAPSVADVPPAAAATPPAAPLARGGPSQCVELRS